MAFSQIATSVTIINSGLIGYCGVSLTNFTTSVVSAIAAGSGVEIAGAFFKADADVTINASSWTAITTATTAYLHLTPSGTAGSQIISAAWSSTEPVWSTSKQGWYASAASAIRVVAKAYKDGPTSQSAKLFLGLNQNQFDSYRMHGFTTVITTAGSSTFTVPNNVYRLKCIILGGGGGGGGGDTTTGGGGGGGAIPHRADATTFSVFPGQVISYTVGAGGLSGTGGSSAGGGTGGSSIFYGITVPGGGGGAARSTYGSYGGAAPAGVVGGMPGCSAIVGGGGNGGGNGGRGGMYITGATIIGGTGQYGGGGGGGYVYSGGGGAGGAGGPGIIVIEY